MELFPLWAVMALVCGTISAGIAESKGRSAGSWFLMGFFFSLIGVILIACLPTTEAKKESEARQREQEALQSGELKKCLYCAEIIKAEAVKCRFCGSDLNSEADT